MRHDLGDLLALDERARTMELRPLIRGPYEAWISTRHGGGSSGSYASQNLGLHVDDDPVVVVANRRSLASHVGHSLDDWVFANQTHGTNVVTVTASERGKGTRSLDDALDDTDAMVTTTVGVTLVLMVADCVPVLMMDTQGAALGVVHAGWRGCAGNIVDGATRAMEGLGAQVGSLRAVIGPAIGRDRYVVGTEVARAIAETGINIDPHLERDGRGLHLDLTGVVRAQLEQAGLRPDEVFDTGHRTGEATPFFSDRAARPCGRFALIARIAPQRVGTFALA